MMVKEGLSELLESFVHAAIELDLFIKAAEDIGNFLLLVEWRQIDFHIGHCLD